MRVGMTQVRLHEVANGYEFFLHGVTHRVVYSDGCWSLAAGGAEELFESFNEAMNAALDVRSF